MGGYTGTILASTIFFAPVVLLGSWLLWWAAYRLIDAPRGSRTATFVLVVSSIYSLFYLTESAGLLVVTPASIQKKYLGRVYAGPLQLRRLELWGFADPGTMWTSNLSPDELGELKQRCKLSDEPWDKSGHCYLFNSTEAHWSQSAWLAGDQLVLFSGAN